MHVNNFRKESGRVMKLSIATLMGVLQSSSSCGGQMSVIFFIEETKTIDRIIRHLELTIEAELVRSGRAASASCCSAGSPVSSRGKREVFLRAFLQARLVSLLNLAVVTSVIYIVSG